jgi:hypothetical protein
MAIFSFPAIAAALVVAILAILFGLGLIAFARRVLENTVAGLVALFAINYAAGALGIESLKITINTASVLLAGVLGLAGVGLLIILNLLGITVG